MRGREAEAEEKGWQRGRSEQRGWGSRGAGGAEGLGEQRGFFLKPARCNELIHWDVMRLIPTLMHRDATH